MGELETLLGQVLQAVRRFDTTDIRRHLVEMVGAADGRVLFLDSLTGSA